MSLLEIYSVHFHGISRKCLYGSDESDFAPVRLVFPSKRETGTVDSRAVLGTNVRLGSNVTIYPFVFIYVSNMA